MDRCSIGRVCTVAALLLSLMSLPGECSEQTSPGSPEEKALSQEDFSLEVARWSDAIRTSPQDSEAYCKRAFAYARMGKWDLAITDLSTAIELDPSKGVLHRHRGTLYFRQSDYGRAIADFDEAIRWGSGDAATYFCRGYASCRTTGDSDRAIADFTECIRLDPNHAEAYGNRGYAYGKKGDLERAIADYSEVIRISPKDEKAFVLRSRALWERGDCDRAIRDLDFVVKLCPDSACYFEMRGALRVEQGDCEGGIADFETAMRLNAADLANDFEGWPKEPVDDASLQHGKLQVQQMLNDRPSMGQYGDAANPLYQWAACKFAGEDLGQRVFWDASDPMPWTTCDNKALPAGPGRIRVLGRQRQGQGTGEERSLEAMWHDAVFELYNVANAKGFKRLQAMAIDGRLSKREYVAKMVELECLAAEKARAFFLRVFLPWAREHDVPIHPSSWFVGRRTSPSDRVVSVPEHAAVWQYHERCFDFWVARALAVKGEYDKALTLLTALQEKAAEGKERSYASCLRGFCLLRLEKTTAAIGAYDQAICLDPKNADSFVGRASAYLESHDNKRALEDCCEAIRLNPTCVEAYRLRSNIHRALGDLRAAEADEAMAKALSGSGTEILDTKEVAGKKSTTMGAPGSHLEGGKVERRKGEEER